MKMHPAERGELEAFRDLFEAAPAGVGARVEEIGGAVCIALPQAPRSAGDVFVRAYGTPEVFRDWVALLPGRPGWRCFIAFDGETPAATGALYAKGGVGWLGIAGTLPEHRRRGAQGAILAARIRAAAEEGCDVVVTETGERVEGRPSSSYRNIERSGFELSYVRANYLSSAAADTSGTL